MEELEKRTWMLSRPAAPAEKMKNPAAPTTYASEGLSNNWGQDCSRSRRAACSPVRSWAAPSSTRGMVKSFQTLEGYRRHLPSLNYLKSLNVNFAINPGSSPIQDTRFDNYSSI